MYGYFNSVIIHFSYHCKYRHISYEYMQILAQI